MGGAPRNGLAQQIEWGSVRFARLHVQGLEINAALGQCGREFAFRANLAGMINRPADQQIVEFGIHNHHEKMGINRLIYGKLQQKHEDKIRTVEG